MLLQPYLTFERAGRQYEVRRPQPQHTDKVPPYKTQLINPDGGYMLTCDPTSSDPGLQCRFSVGSSEWAYVISSRYVHQYKRMMSGFDIHPDKQLIEVGAGLSQAAVEWADRAALLQPQGPKPIVIDPANYHLMGDMINTAIELAPQEPHIEKLLHVLQDLKYRCSVILDPDRIRLLSMRLEDAHCEHAELQGTANTVVDYYAAASYPNADATSIVDPDERNSAREMTYALERSFLQPGGTHFFYA